MESLGHFGPMVDQDEAGGTAGSLTLEKNSFLDGFTLG